MILLYSFTIIGYCFVSWKLFVIKILLYIFIKKRYIYIYISVKITLASSSTRLMLEREDKKADDQKPDEELQFNLQLLGEVISAKNVMVYRY